MSFRVEFPLGNGHPRFWEVGCDFCEVVGSLSLQEFPDFPSAFEHALGVGWDIIDTVRGKRYMCPGCCARENPRGGEDE